MVVISSSKRFIYNSWSHVTGFLRLAAKVGLRGNGLLLFCVTTTVDRKRKRKYKATKKSNELGR